MNALQLRPARPHDREAMMALQIDVFYGEQHIPRDIVTAFAALRPQCWVAELNGAIVGTAAAWYEGRQLHWGRFTVAKPLRGQHIGTRLAAYSFADLFAQGADSIFMEARDITAAMVCAMGGTIVGKTVPFYKGTVTPVVLTKERFRQP